MHAPQRARNLHGAFTVQRPCDNLRIAIVDDVLTTGATAASLAWSLRAAGAADVEVWCLARTPAPAFVSTNPENWTMFRTLPLLLALLSTSLSAAEPLRIAVAANFRATLEEINLPFSATSGQRILLSSASTGVLATQVRHGAPFHLLLAADAEAPAALADQGLAAPFCYALGRLALVGGDSDDLADPAHSVAIANPRTAPYGRAALEVLQRPAFAAGDRRKLVRGNNVVQAYQFWYSGAVDLALVALSQAGTAGNPIPADWHAPLEQHALVLAAHPALDAYLKWLRSDTVRSLILDAGYHTCP